MTVSLIAAILILCMLLTLLTLRRKRERQELAAHTITPKDLHTLLAEKQSVLLFDVRQPLDLLTDSEIIPGAQRLSPSEVIANPSLIPKETETIVYCTCPADESSRRILRRALDMGYKKVRFLKGGLAGWKANGYPVQPYEKPFHLEPAAP